LDELGLVESEKGNEIQALSDDLATIIATKATLLALSSDLDNQMKGD